MTLVERPVWQGFNPPSLLAVLRGWLHVLTALPIICLAHPVNADPAASQEALNKCTSGVLEISELERTFFESGWRLAGSNRKDTLLSTAFLPLVSAAADRHRRSDLNETIFSDALHVIDDAFERRRDKQMRVFVSPPKFSTMRTLVVAKAEPGSSWKAKFLWCTIVSGSFLPRPDHYPEVETSWSGGSKGVNLAGPLEQTTFSDGQSAEAFLWATVWFQSKGETTNLSGAVFPPYTYIRTQTKYDDAETFYAFSERLIEIVR